MVTFIKRKSFVSAALSVLVSALFVYAGVSASTTISTDITTDGDTTIGSGARVGTGSTVTHFTALADDSFFVEGAAEVDGLIWADGGLVSAASSTVVGVFTTSGHLNASSTLGVSGLAQFASGSLDLASSTVVGAFTATGNLTASSSAFVATDLLTGSLLIGTTTSNIQKVEVVGNGLFTGSATTSVIIDSTGSAKGGCLQLKGSDNLWYMIFIKPTSTKSVNQEVLEVKQGDCTSAYAN